MKEDTIYFLIAANELILFQRGCLSSASDRPSVIMSMKINVRWYICIVWLFPKVSSVDSDWQRKGKLAPFSDLTAHPDLSTMLLDDIFGDKQAEARPFWSRESALVECIKTLKDPGLIIRRNSYAGIFDSGF